MIFSLKHHLYTSVLLGEKQLTTRLRLPAHIAIGKVWAMVPKRASPAWWFGLYGGIWIVVTSPQSLGIEATGEPLTHRQSVEWLDAQGFVQARIRIDAFWQTPLQEMTEFDALDEGVASVEEYSRLWDSINDRKGARWGDNPTAYRIHFTLLEDVCEAVARVGCAAIMAAAKGPTP